MTYVLLLVLIVSGERVEFVIEDGISADECIGIVYDNPGLALRCEPDANAQPPAAPKPAELYL